MIAKLAKSSRKQGGLLCGILLLVLCVFMLAYFLVAVFGLGKKRDSNGYIGKVNILKIHFAKAPL